MPQLQTQHTYLFSAFRKMIPVSAFKIWGKNICVYVFQVLQIARISDADPYCDCSRNVVENVRLRDNSSNFWPHAKNTPANNLNDWFHVHFVLLFTEVFCIRGLN